MHEWVHARDVKGALPGPTEMVPRVPQDQCATREARYGSGAVG